MGFNPSHLPTHVVEIIFCGDKTFSCFTFIVCVRRNHPVSTVTVSHATIRQPLAQHQQLLLAQRYFASWANVAPTSIAYIVPTLPQPSTNIVPTISQRCPNHQPTLPHPSANLAPTINQHYPNHIPVCFQPSKTNIFIIKIFILFQITISFFLSIAERTKILCNIIMYI